MFIIKLKRKWGIKIKIVISRKNKKWNDDLQIIILIGWTGKRN